MHDAGVHGRKSHGGGGGGGGGRVTRPHDHGRWGTIIILISIVHDFGVRGPCFIFLLVREVGDVVVYEDTIPRVWKIDLKILKKKKTRVGVPSPPPPSTTYFRPDAASWHASYREKQCVSPPPPPPARLRRDFHPS